MKSFAYVARDRSAEELKGTIEAADRNAALAKLSRMGLFPISVTEAGAPNPSAMRRNKPQSSPSSHLSCPKCLSTSIRKPYGGRAFAVWFGTLVLNGICMEVFGTIRRSSFAVEMFFDTSCFALLASLVWMLVNSLLGKSRCKQCGYRWKVEGAAKQSATPLSPTVPKEQHPQMNQEMPTIGKSSKLSGLAITSLVLAITTWTPIFGLIFGPQTSAIIAVIICLILAVVFGHVSRRTIRRSARQLTGYGVALAGLILGYGKILDVAGSFRVAMFIRDSDTKKVAAAQEQIKAYDVALQVFCLETGTCPSTDQGLQALITRPTGEYVRMYGPPNRPVEWRGPYIKSPVITNDPWGRPYVYICPPQKNPDRESFDLYSVGRDGLPDTDDDIVSWNRDFAQPLSGSDTGQRVRRR